MTREESIDRLRKISEKTPIRTNGDDLLAITMAIQALSQEPCDDATLKDIFCMGCEYKEQEPCDCISREAVMEYIKNCTIDLGYENGTNMVLDAISSMPSIQPKPKTDVLDKIRDEIEQKIPNVEYDIGNGLAIAISIIDKYTKGEQE